MITPNTIFWIIFIGVTIASTLVQSKLQSKMKKYSTMPLLNGLTGHQVAEQMLRDHGINNVTVGSVAGQLTDHFNPANMTVNLSEIVDGRCSIASAAVAAHECGHAVQHATGYAPLRLRSALVPAVSFASKLIPWVLLAGMFLIEVFPQLLLIGIAGFALTALFSVVTLPVEIDASRRAVAWLDRTGIVPPDQHQYAADALKWAAYTYVVAAVSSLATLFYYITVYTSRR